MRGRCVSNVSRDMMAQVLPMAWTTARRTRTSFESSHWLNITSKAGNTSEEKDEAVSAPSLP